MVTGGQGFVGRWLTAHLVAAGDRLVGPDRVDVTDAPALAAAVAEAAPDAIYHLAALTHVGRSWAEPAGTFAVNAVGTLHLLDAARACPRPPRVLVASSAEIYGVVTPADLPLTEGSPLRPVSPYAVSKVAAEYLALQAHLGFGLEVVRARSFNHIGPGQDPTFVVPALAGRIVAAVAAGRRSVPVGNLSARRDFTDVRDVVRAYRLLIERGQAGEVYNVCSGRDVGIGDLAARLLELAGADLALVTDPALSRPVDVPVLLGDPRRLAAATGWRAQIPVDETLAAMIEAERAALAAAAGGLD